MYSLGKCMQKYTCLSVHRLSALQVHLIYACAKSAANTPSLKCHDHAEEPSTDPPDGVP